MGVFFFCRGRILQDTNYWKQQLWATHDQVECEVMQGMHDQGLPVVKVRGNETVRRYSVNRAVLAVRVACQQTDATVRVLCARVLLLRAKF